MALSLWFKCSQKMTKNKYGNSLGRNAWMLEFPSSLLPHFNRTNTLNCGHGACPDNIQVIPKIDSVYILFITFILRLHITKNSHDLIRVQRSQCYTEQLPGVCIALLMWAMTMAIVRSCLHVLPLLWPEGGASSPKTQLKNTHVELQHNNFKGVLKRINWTKYGTWQILQLHKMISIKW